MGQSFDIERFVDEQRLSRFNLNLLVWSFLAMFADGFDISALSFAVPALTRLWQVPPQAFGIALSASLFGILFGALSFGYIGDRFGRRPAIIAGCIIYGVATLAITGAADINQLTALRFVTGVGLGGLMPNSIALTSELSPRRWRATLIVLMFVGITLGGAAPSLVAKLLVPHFGWQSLFVIGGGAPLLIALGLRFALPESIKVLALRPNRHAELLRIARRMRPQLALPDDTQFHARPAPPSAGTGLRQIFAPGLAPITALLWVCFATALMANFFLNGWLPLIFEQSGLSPERAAIATGWYHVGGTLGGLVVSVLLDRVGVIVMVVMFALAAPVVAAIGWSGHSYAAFDHIGRLVGLLCSRCTEARQGDQCGQSSVAVPRPADRGDHRRGERKHHDHDDHADAIEQHADDEAAQRAAHVIPAGGNRRPLRTESTLLKDQGQPAIQKEIRHQRGREADPEQRRDRSKTRRKDLAEAGSGTGWGWPRAKPSVVRQRQLRTHATRDPQQFRVSIRSQRENFDGLRQSETQPERDQQWRAAADHKQALPAEMRHEQLGNEAGRRAAERDPDEHQHDQRCAPAPG